jgi:hypothetical protein
MELPRGSRTLSQRCEPLIVAGHIAWQGRSKSEETVDIIKFILSFVPLLLVVLAALYFSRL